MQNNNLQDSVLVSRYIDGSEYALEVLIMRHKQKIYSFIYSKILNKDTTDDIFQDTFIKVINTLKKGKYNEQGKFLPWVMRIAHNLMIDFFRKNKRMPKFNNTDDFDIFSILSDKTLNAENQLINEQIYSSIKGLIKELPENQKEVLIMRLFKDMSFKEIAESTDVSINTALGRMRYALINMRKLVKENNIILSA